MKVPLTNMCKPFRYGQTVYCGVRALVGAPGCRRASSSKAQGLLSRVFWLVAPSPPARSRPAVRYILDLPQSSLSRPSARSTASPTPEYSTTVFQVHRRGRNPPSISLPRPDVGGTPSTRPGSSRLSVCLPDRPSPSRNPAFRCQ